MKKRDAIHIVSKEKLVNIISESGSLREVQKKLYNSKRVYGSRHNKIVEKINSLDIDLKELKKRGLENLNEDSRFNKIDNEEVFVQNSKYSNNTSVKKRLFKDFGWKNKCSECTVEGIYNDKPLTLQLDHINGIPDDNRLENLRLLCPNCHSQTATFAGRNTKKVHLCEDCSEEKLTKASKKCSTCSKNRKITVSTNEMTSLLIEKRGNLRKVGEKLLVSDNAIRKFCLKNLIDWKVFKTQ